MPPRYPKDEQHQLKRHKKDLEKHLPYDQLKERKRAGKLRRAFRKDEGEVREQRVTEDNWESLLDKHGHSHKRPLLSTLVEELRIDEPVFSEEDRTGSAIVISVASGRCKVFLDGQELDCLIPKELALLQKAANNLRSAVDEAASQAADARATTDEKWRELTEAWSVRGGYFWDETPSPPAE